MNYVAIILSYFRFYFRGFSSLEFEELVKGTALLFVKIGKRSENVYRIRLFEDFAVNRFELFCSKEFRHGIQGISFFCGGPREFFDVFFF